jgi:xanthine dehydrogenase small subunit
MRDYVTFILNNEVQTFSGLAGDTTLLAWLRRTRGLTGSKEGCAEGDCGACTVVVARPDNTQCGTGPNPDGTIIWRPVNACILFMGMLEGASVTTIEGTVRWCGRSASLPTGDGGFSCLAMRLLHARFCHVAVCRLVQW